MGRVLADYPDRPDESDHRSRPRCRRARVRCDDADEEDRRRRNRGGAARLRWQSVIARIVQIGGQTKVELLERLALGGVEINEAGRVLFASDKFITSDVRTQLTTAELSVRHLGFPQGATISDLYASATRFGLRLCPLELGPHLR